ncbi:hypothetical protein V499_01306 [Pseudogymnoascus sp. VKM F-103]|nr:hypothetical protein V499_01306 [Pseudogymnoascus sp. VKM F-103]
MAADGGGSPHDLVVQSWIMYSIGIALFAMRLFVRIKRFGLKLQIEDYLMVLAVFWYTAFVITNIKIIDGGGSSLYLPGEFETFTPDDIKQRITGSKIEFASEQCMLNVVYTLKACMLILYYRVTSNLRQQFSIKICAAYTAVGFIATELVLFFNCYPFSGYWTLPPPQEECATYFRYLVVQCVFNLTSDVSILCVIIPVLWRMHMSMKEKLPLLFIFSLGSFLIICAATSKAFTFKNVFDDSYQFWYLREASVGMYISNIPYIWGFLRHTFTFLRASSGLTANSQAGYGRRPSRGNALNSTNDYSHKTSMMRIGLGKEGLGTSESEENIISASASPSDFNLSDMDTPKGIHKTTEIHITREASV